MPLMRSAKEAMVRDQGRARARNESKNEGAAVDGATARIKYRTEFAGIGCAIQGIGLLLLFLFPIGTIAGIGLLIYGSRKASYCVCGNCGNRISDAEVRMCPVCRATLAR